MEIAPGIQSDVWKTLNLDDPLSADWVRAIQIFKRRIVGRYIDAADFLIDADQIKPASERRFGFAIMAIDCLLIETLAAFREGSKDTKGKSLDIFTQFLLSRPGFVKYFDQQKAKQFYIEFRCGILHQAEVGGTSRVWSVGEAVIYESGSFRVNRTEFHKLIKAEIDSYENELTQVNNSPLRTNFREKMNFICR